jgi:hypothetical protein
MSPWRKALEEGLVAGSVASVASAAALVVAGRYEGSRGAAPLNAISHWVWDHPAFREDRPNLRHTVLGYLVHHAASVFWGVLHARAWGSRREAKQAGPALAGAAAAAALACFVDQRMTPERLTPGFEHRLSRKALAGVYISFALGLALGSMAAAQRRHNITTRARH